MRSTSGAQRGIIDHSSVEAGHRTLVACENPLIPSLADLRPDSPSSSNISLIEMDFEQLVQFGLLPKSKRMEQINLALNNLGGPKQDLALLSQIDIPTLIKIRWLRFYSSLDWRILFWLQRVLALLLLIVLAPVFAIIAINIKLSSRGPVFFKQERLGWLCQPFLVYKFRSMIHDAEAATGPVWASKNDVRYTGVGRILRATRLDELPQLINVVRGEMSLIGFRPIRYYFARLLSQDIPYYELRFFVMPGITGWPQVWHDYAGSVEGQKAKFEYELHYLLWSDWRIQVEIILRTLLTVIRRIGQ